MGLRYLILLAIFLILVGCGDKKEANSKINNEVAKASGIEIIENIDAKKIKVQDRDKNSSNSSYYLNYGIKGGYDLKAEPANKDAYVRVRPRDQLDANINIRSPYENVMVSLVTKKLSIDFKVKCSACHNDYANGVIGPSLLGKDDNYIYNKIMEFKTGKKSNPLMKDLIKKMSNDDIRDMAKEIYKFNKEIEKLGAKK